MDSPTDSDKLRTRQLDDKSNYTLLRIRIWAATSSRGLDDVFGNTVQEDQVKSTKRKQQASNIIGNALRDPALRILRSFIGNPKDTLIKLDVRYDSKSTVFKISRMSEVVSDRYASLRKNVSKHIDRLLRIIE